MNINGAGEFKILYSRLAKNTYGRKELIKGFERRRKRYIWTRWNILPGRVDPYVPTVADSAESQKPH